MRVVSKMASGQVFEEPSPLSKHAPFEEHCLFSPQVFAVLRMSHSAVHNPLLPQCKPDLQNACAPEPQGSLQPGSGSALEQTSMVPPPFFPPQLLTTRAMSMALQLVEKCRIVFTKHHTCGLKP